MVKQILEKGAATVQSVAVQTMNEVREAIGLTNQYSFFDYTKGVGQSHGNTITIDQFAAVQLKVGKVIAATHPEKSEKLIRLQVNFGPKAEESEDEVRIIFTGVRGFGYTKDDFIGKQFFFVYNLQPRKMMNEESQGMILAADSSNAPEGKPIFISAEGMPVGSTIR